MHVLAVKANGCFSGLTYRKPVDKLAMKRGDIFKSTSICTKISSQVCCSLYKSCPLNPYGRSSDLQCVDLHGSTVMSGHGKHYLGCPPAEDTKDVLHGSKSAM